MMNALFHVSIFRYQKHDDNMFSNIEYYYAERFITIGKIWVWLRQKMSQKQDIVYGWLIVGSKMYLSGSSVERMPRVHRDPMMFSNG